MSVKIAVLKSGEDVIADIKEIVEKETEKGISLLFENAYVVTVEKQNTMFLTEETAPPSANIHFTPWMPLTRETKIMIPHDWVVTIVEPHEDILNSYLEKFGETNDSTSNHSEE
jgi:hypothetical protein